MTTTPSTTRGSNTGGAYPRSYLLGIYNAAIEHGHILLSPITQQQAKSLSMALINQRRRASTTNAQFILPEFHMVTVGTWRPDDGGTLPILYSSSPDFDLPTIRTLQGETIALTEPKKLPPATPTPTANLADFIDDLEVDAEDPDFDAGSYVEQLRREAGKDA